MVEALGGSSVTKNIQVVVVEDDDSIQSLIKDSLLLASEGVQVSGFKSATQAIETMWGEKSTHSPMVDILFLDIHLDDDTDGFEVLEYSEFLAQKVPVVLMSSTFSPEYLQRISQLKSDPVLLKKPFGPAQVLRLANWIIGQRLGGKYEAR